MLAVAILAAGHPNDAAAGGGCHEPDPKEATDAAGSAVEMGNCAFGPTVLRIEPGAQVTWTNKSEAVHSVTGLSGGWGDTKELRPGNAVSYSFDAKGTYPYSCVLHPGMVGAVVVGDGVSSDVRAGAAVRQVADAGPIAGDDVPAEAASDDSGGVSATVAGLLAGVAGLLAGAVAGAVLTRRRGMPGQEPPG
ncbi:MAG TPA: plastocyanin/azurin family copper-binding protein [Gemmatimonadales bacterium]|nr:plastocyanin/azurin family copper-binding protein [Gemmatimonadales bacterium]